MAEDDAGEMEVIAWHGLTSGPNWDLVMERSGQELQRLYAICTDPATTEHARMVAAGEVKAWSEVRTWRKNYQEAYEAMVAQAAPPEKDDENLVGAKLEEQWYSKE